MIIDYNGREKEHHIKSLSLTLGSSYFSIDNGLFGIPMSIRHAEAFPYSVALTDENNDLALTIQSCEEVEALVYAKNDGVLSFEIRGDFSESSSIHVDIRVCGLKTREDRAALNYMNIELNQLWSDLISERYVMTARERRLLIDTIEEHEACPNSYTHYLWEGNGFSLELEEFSLQAMVGTNGDVSIDVQFHKVVKEGIEYVETHTLGEVPLERKNTKIFIINWLEEPKLAEEVILQYSSEEYHIRILM